MARPLRIELKTKVNRESSDRTSLQGRWNWEQVVQAVEKTRGEKWEDFANRHGDAGLGMAFYVARRCTGLTLRQLGVSAGGMDYSAVAASIKRFAQRLQRESSVRAQVQAILKHI